MAQDKGVKKVIIADDYDRYIVVEIHNPLLLEKEILEIESDYKTNKPSSQERQK